MITKCEKNEIVKNDCIIQLFFTTFIFITNYDNKNLNYQILAACLPRFLPIKNIVTEYRKKWIFLKNGSLNPAKFLKVVK